MPESPPYKPLEPLRPLEPLVSLCKLRLFSEKMDKQGFFNDLRLNLHTNPNGSNSSNSSNGLEWAISHITVTVGKARFSTFTQLEWF